MDYNKVEDAVLKKAMEFFKDNAVKFFGIDTKIIAPASTMDFLLGKFYFTTGLCKIYSLELEY